MEMGGAERVAASLVNAWAEKGYAVALVSTHAHSDGSFYKLSSNVMYRPLAGCMRGRKGGRVFAYLNRLLFLRDLIVSFRPDVVVGFLPNVNVMMLLAALGLGIRTIACERTDPFHMPIPRLLRLARGVTYPLASLLVVQTEAVARRIQREWLFVRHVSVIGNPIPFNPVNEVKSIGKVSRKRLLAVGRLAQEKCFDRVIEAFAELASTYPEWDLRIVGEGPDRHRLEQAVEKHNLEERVLLPGSSTAIQEEFDSADIFVLTSMFEGFPNALLEAMAVGLPCVTVDCPSGPREISEDGFAAVLVPLGDREALVKELGLLMGDEARRVMYGGRAKRSVWAKYSLRVVIERWDSVLFLL